MLYTLTLNPAVDLVINISDAKIGAINRASSSDMFVGGKGINVSKIFHILSRKSIALGFVGGFTGSFIVNELDKENIQHDFVVTSKPTRINVKINGGIETAINTPGPEISSEEIERLKDKIRQLKNTDVLICSGRIPESISFKDFDSIINIAYSNKVQLVFDMSNDELLKMLKYKPFLIKPNKEELEEFTSSRIVTDTDLIDRARKLIKMGARNVLVSLGKDGAALINKDNVYFAKAPKGEVVSTVGAGDSAVAGFIDELLKTKNLKSALRKAVVVGSATAFSSGLADLNKIEEVGKDYE